MSDKTEKTVEKTETAANTVETKAKVNASAFVARKLNVLNTKSGARYERTAARVVENNKGGK